MNKIEKYNSLIFIYVRISTIEQKLNTSIKNQIKIIKHYFKGYKKISIFSDIESGSSIQKRKGYNTMIQQILDNKNQNKIIIGVYKLDRLHRSILNLMKFIEFIKKNNIGLISITEKLDLSTPQGIFFLQMIGIFGEFERKVIKERMISGKLYKLTNNQFIGGNLPFGYNYDKLKKKIIINKNYINIIKYIFELKNLGYGIYSISKLVKLKFKSLKILIYPMKIYRILKNYKSYLGYFKQNISNKSKFLRIKPILKRKYNK